MKKFFQSKSVPQIDVIDVPINVWTVNNLSEWLTRERYNKSVIQAITKAGFDGGALMNFHIDDLVDSKVPEPVALTIYIKIQDLKKRQSQMGILHGYVADDSSDMVVVVAETTTTSTSTATTTTTTSEL